MSALIKSPKDFWAGLIYVGFGAGALWLAADYRFGTAGRMGPGYFPKVLATVLILIGVVSLARSFATNGEPIGAIAWKQLALVLLACALFGLLLQPLGLVVALLALCLVSAAASPKFGFDWKARVLVTRPISATMLVLASILLVLVLLPAFGKTREEAFKE